MLSTLERMISLFFLLLRLQQSSTLFPYTTLFRSAWTTTSSTLGSAIQPHNFWSSLNRPSRRKSSPSFTPYLSPPFRADRKSTRLNSSHLGISYAVFCLKKKINTQFLPIHSENACN